MTPRAAWSDHEDSLLKNAISIHGEDNNWKNVALMVPGRTNKACRKRWLHSLQPTVKKTQWTREEDDELLRSYIEFGEKWSIIARRIPGRTDDACSKRYRESLDPNLKKDAWSTKEDNMLLCLYDQIGSRWKDIGIRLQRSSLGCRNRWKLLDRMQRKHPDPSQSLSPYDLPFENLPTFYGDDRAPFEMTTTQDVNFNYAASSSLAEALADSPCIFTTQSLSSVPGSSLSQVSPVDLPPHSPFTTQPDIAIFGTPSQSLSDSVYCSPLHHFPTSCLSPLSSRPSESSLINALLSPHQPSQNCNLYNDLSSVDSTPLSTTSIDLPTIQSPEESEPESVLFSVTTAKPYKVQNADTDRDQLRQHQFTIRVENLPSARVSYYRSLDLDDSMLPYACGNPQCWPTDAVTGTSCYATSKELVIHQKENHSGGCSDFKPYRCGLEGCNKSWKSLNGLQYHLQVSTDHYKDALSSRLSAEAGQDAIGVSQEEGSSELKFSCKHPKCFKSYKTLSGLKYHKQNGHPKKIPMQLASVPLSWEKDISQKTKKMKAAINSGRKRAPSKS